MRILTPEQAYQLHTWIAAGYHYPQLAQLMREQFGVTISASAITWHRQQYASVIAELQATQQKQNERRERDKRAKQVKRAGHGGHHCPTCGQPLPPAA